MKLPNDPDIEGYVIFDSDTQMYYHDGVSTAPYPRVFSRIGDVKASVRRSLFTRHRKFSIYEPAYKETVKVYSIRTGEVVGTMISMLKGAIDSFKQNYPDKEVVFRKGAWY